MLKKTAVTAYAAFYPYQFGPNYLRPLGANNPADGVDRDLASFNGRGNIFPASGTGNTFLFQLGYLFPAMGQEGKKGQLQPYTMMQYSRFERLADPMLYYDIGLNWYLKGHTTKFSLNVQNRPIFFERMDGIRQEDRKLMVVLQFQVRFE